MQRVYEAMAENPNLSEKEAMAAVYQTSKGAAQRGTDVHKLIELAENGKIDLRSVPEYQRPYIQAYRSWRLQLQPEIVASEMTVYSDKHHVAGTLDMVCRLGLGSITAIVDVKTGKAEGRLYPEIWLQLAMLRQGYREQHGEVDGVAGLLLKADGVPIWEFRPNVPLAPYLAALELWKWAHPKHKLNWDD